MCTQTRAQLHTETDAHTGTYTYIHAHRCMPMHTHRHTFKHTHADTHTSLSFFVPPLHVFPKVCTLESDPALLIWEALSSPTLFTQDKVHTTKVTRGMCPQLAPSTSPLYLSSPIPAHPCLVLVASTNIRQVLVPCTHDSISYVFISHVGCSSTKIFLWFFARSVPTQSQHSTRASHVTVLF